MVEQLRLLGRTEESGARLNRRRLSEACLLAHALGARCGPEPQSQSQIQPRAGAIQEAVIRVLAAAERPLRAREIHVAAEKLAGTPLSWNTVKDCLHKHARRPDSPIERVSHGRYRYL
ncbi:MAG: hypothetical protein ABR521_07790 [Gaiellaceae bacterium]